MAAMSSLSDVTLGELRTAALRYRPVVLTVLAILVIVALTPGEEAAPLRRLARPGGGGSVDAAPASSATAPAGGEDGAGDLAFTPAPAFAGGGGFSIVEEGETVGPGSFEVAVDDDAATGGSGFTGGSFSTSTSSAPRPLSIVATAWATRTAGTPLAANGVPAGTLPVGKRLGQDDKRSFVRLDGEKSVLGLTEDPGGTRAPTGGAAGVRACLITAPGWQEGEAQALPGPPFDENQCAVGQRANNGTWTFDLSAFASPSDPRGFALVPAAGTAVDFQVAFIAIATGS